MSSHKNTKPPPDSEAPFKETLKLIRRFKDYLRCVKCGSIPETIYTTNRCEHKYCGKCVEPVKGNQCLICDVEVAYECVGEDKFLTGLVPLIKNKP